MCAGTAGATVAECIFTALSNFHSVNANVDVNMCVALQVVAIVSCCFFFFSFLLSFRTELMAVCVGAAK